MKKYILIISVVVILIGGLFVLFQQKNNNGVACTMEAKMCPDGSYVGRSGPKCEFTECPTVSTTTETKIQSRGILIGQVTLSPTCPVEKIPPEEQCAPKPYSTLMNIRAKGFSTYIHTDTSGKFYIPLIPDTYTISIYVTSLYPSCPLKEAVVNANSTTTVDISCDTGIR